MREAAAADVSLVATGASGTEGAIASGASEIAGTTVDGASEGVFGVAVFCGEGAEAVAVGKGGIAVEVEGGGVTGAGREAAEGLGLVKLAISFGGAVSRIGAPAGAAGRAVGGGAGSAEPARYLRMRTASSSSRLARAEPLLGIPMRVQRSTRSLLSSFSSLASA